MLADALFQAAYLNSVISFVGKLDNISWGRKEAVWWCRLTLKKWRIYLILEFLLTSTLFQQHPAVPHSESEVIIGKPVPCNGYGDILLVDITTHHMECD